MDTSQSDYITYVAGFGLLVSFFFLIYLLFKIFGCFVSLLLCIVFSCGEQGLLFIAVRRLLIAVASLVAEHGL